LRVARAYKGDSPPEVRARIYDYSPTPSFRVPPTPPLFRNPPDTPLFEAKLQRCIIVSNDCVTLAKEDNRALTLGAEAKKQAWPWHVAPVEPWPAASQLVPTREGDRPLGELIEAGRVHRYLALPECALVPKSYVDFRHLTPLKPQLFEKVARVVSVSDLGQAYLWAKVFTYFSARAFPAEVACPKCGGKFSLADLKPIDSVDS